VNLADNVGAGWRNDWEIFSEFAKPRDCADAAWSVAFLENSQDFIKQVNRGIAFSCGCVWI
jgi:hypothetical protein